MLKFKTPTPEPPPEPTTIEQALMKMYQDATLEPLYFAKAVNQWPSDIYFSVTNCQLTTLDQGTGATKNTGLTPETEEK